MRFLLATPALLVALTLGAACNNAQPPAPNPSPPASAAIDFVELHPSGGTDQSPVIVAFHGRGDTPEDFAAAFADFPAPAEVLVPRGPHRVGDGFGWYRKPPEISVPQMAADVRDSIDAVWPAVLARAKTRPIYVTGFSQGGVMSFAIARYRPAQVAHAFPVAGRLPPELMPAKGELWPAQTDAYHGEADTTIPYADGKQTVDAFAAAGSAAVLHSYPGVAHSMMPMRNDLFAALIAAFPKN